MTVMQSLTFHGPRGGNLAGDDAFFGRKSLLKRCLRWTNGDVAEAEDLLGDACLQVMEAAKLRSLTVMNPSSFWLTVINNLGRDRLRRSRRWRREPDEQGVIDSLQAQGGSAEDLVFLRECLARTANDFQRLGARQQSALFLRISGVDYSKIAELLVTSEANARKLVETARSSLAAPPSTTRLEHRARRPRVRGNG